MSSSLLSLGLGLLALSSSTSAAPKPLTDSTIAPRADTSGCGITHAGGFHDPDATKTFKSGKYDRTYGIFVPQNYDANKQHKLIVDYHGRGGDPRSQYENSQYYRNDRGKEYIVVYPAGLKKAWQGASYAEEDGKIDDVSFTNDLLARIRSKYCIDSEHIYASGKSNGGGFVDTLACSSVGDQFAAFAMAAAALYTDNSKDSCKKKRAIFESHGEADDTIHYEGGQGLGGTTPNVGEWVTWWAQRNGCDPDKDRNDTAMTGFEISTWSCNGLDDVVKHYHIANGGHCWPSVTGDTTDGMRTTCQDRSVNFTDRVLQYFGRWSLSNAPKN